MNDRKDISSLELEIAELRGRIAELEARERELRPALAALSQSEERFRTVFDNVQSGIMLVDSAGRVLMANPPALQILGLSDSTVGRVLGQIAPAAARMVSPGSPPGQRRLELESADGQSRLVNYACEPVSLGRSKGMIILFHDVTQAHRAEERRRRTEQLACVGELAARLSHDLKTPIATIKTGLKVIARQFPGQEADLMATLRKELDDVNELITKLLGAARHEEFTPCLTGLASLTRDSCDLFSGHALRTRKKMEVKIPEREIPVIADTRAMSRAFSNLVQNALEASPDGGSVAVEVGLLGPDETARFFPGFKGEVARVGIIDDGPGIPDKVLARIFEPFFTTKDAGTGLGLAVAHEIIGSHGGMILISSRPGQTVCEVCLPAGGRPPCWDWVVYHDWEIFDEDPCLNCNIRNSSGQLCWTAKAMLENPFGESYRERCVQCPVYYTYNLAQYHDPAAFHARSDAAGEAAARREPKE